MKLKSLFAAALCLTIVFSMLVIPVQAVNARRLDNSTANLSMFTERLGKLMSNHKVTDDQIVFPPKDPEKVVYLTFDDGPDPAWTIKILDILERYQAGATFYMIGASVVSHPEIVREVASRKQTIAVHSFNHVDLSGVGFPYFYNEIHDTETAITNALQGDQQLIQQFGRCMRPPYGKKSPLLAANAEAMNYEVSMWNIDTKDWSGLSPEEIFDHFKSALEPQKVILMHDGGLDRSNTVKALELILHELLMQGYIVLPYCTQDGQAIKTSN